MTTPPTKHSVRVTHRFTASPERVFDAWLDRVPVGTGCELTLTNEGVPAEWKDETASGWAKILDGLDRTLAA
jgi:hypothetical protein